MARSGAYYFLHKEALDGWWIGQNTILSSFPGLPQIEKLHACIVGMELFYARGMDSFLNISLSTVQFKERERLPDVDSGRRSAI